MARTPKALRSGSKEIETTAARPERGETSETNGTPKSGSVKKKQPHKTQQRQNRQASARQNSFPQSCEEASAHAESAAGTPESPPRAAEADQQRPGRKRMSSVGSDTGRKGGRPRRSRRRSDRQSPMRICRRSPMWIPLTIHRYDCGFSAMYSW